MSNLTLTERKKINDEESWQWRLTFIGKKQLHSYYLYYMIDKVMLENPNLKGIVELGTGDGALTYVLGLWGIYREIPVLSIDIRDVRDEKIFKALKIKFLQIDEFSKEAENAITLFLNMIEGPVLFICDGRLKTWEFNFWAPKLEPESIIATHDWLTEIKYPDIKEIVEKHCTPYKQKRWNEMNVEFATFKVN